VRSTAKTSHRLPASALMSTKVSVTVASSPEPLGAYPVRRVSRGHQQVRHRLDERRRTADVADRVERPVPGDPASAAASTRPGRAGQPGGVRRV
jgi:hypothetical protein